MFLWLSTFCTYVSALTSPFQTNQLRTHILSHKYIFKFILHSYTNTYDVPQQSGPHSYQQFSHLYNFRNFVAIYSQKIVAIISWSIETNILGIPFHCCTSAQHANSHLKVSTCIWRGALIWCLVVIILCSTSRYE